MAVFVPFANGVELVTVFEYSGGGTAKVIQGFHFNEPASVASLITFTQFVADWYGAQSLRPWWESWSIVGMVANALDEQDGYTYTNTVGGAVTPFPIVGSVSGPGTPVNSAMVVTAQTGFRGRSFRGRNYWPGMPATYTESTSSWTVAAVGDWNNFLSDFITAANANATDWVVLSRYANHEARPDGLMTPVLDVRAQTKMGTMRRRVQGTFGSF